MNLIRRWRRRTRSLKGEVQTLYLAIKDPRTPWYAKVSAGIVVAYALSPIDLIPDPIPILGHLDDLILIPLGLALVMKMIPPAVLAESRSRAQGAEQQRRPANWIAAAVIIAIWLLLIGLTVRYVVHMMER